MEKIPDGIKINRRVFKFEKIYRKFSSTEFGRKLAKNIRWERYKPGRTTKAEWEFILGPDVNNLKHLKVTYILARKFINNCVNLPILREKPPLRAKFSVNEQEDLLLASIIHDWAEIIVGDQTYDLKTQNFEKLEYKILKKITADMYHRESHQFLVERMHNVIDTVVKNRNTKLGRAFSAIETIGYLETGLRAWQKSKARRGDLKVGLQWVTNNVLSNQIIKLIEYSKTYPSVALCLKKHQRTISDAYQNLPDSIFDKYNAKEREEKRKQFDAERQSWNKFIA